MVRLCAVFSIDNRALIVCLLSRREDLRFYVVIVRPQHEPMDACRHGNDSRRNRADT